MQVSIHNSILVRSTEFSRHPPVQTPSMASENYGVTTHGLLSACSPIHYHSIPCWKHPLALHSPRQSISVPYKDLDNPTASWLPPVHPHHRHSGFLSYAYTRRVPFLLNAFTHTLHAAPKPLPSRPFSTRKKTFAISSSNKTSPVKPAGSLQWLLILCSHSNLFITVILYCPWLFSLYSPLSSLYLKCLSQTGYLIYV